MSPKPKTDRVEWAILVICIFGIILAQVVSMDEGRRNPSVRAAGISAECACCPRRRASWTQPAQCAIVRISPPPL
jgi:hypothetical protein